MTLVHDGKRFLGQPPARAPRCVIGGFAVEEAGKILCRDAACAYCAVVLRIEPALFRDSGKRALPLLRIGPCVTSARARHRRRKHDGVLVNVSNK